MPNGMCRSRKRSTWRPRPRPNACRPRTSAAPMRRLRPSASRSSRVTDWLDWPFFEPRHRELAERLADWCQATIHDAHPSDADYACRALVKELGKAGFLKLCVSDDRKTPDVRSLAI